MSQQIIRAVRAWHTETVRITWTGDDGARHEQDVTFPPSTPPVAAADPAFLRTPVDALPYDELTIRVSRALRRAGCETVADVVQKRAFDFQPLRGVGQVTLRELRAWLLSHGLYLKGEVPR